MRWLSLLLLFLHVGCATQYILPGNRFMTPETQGANFRTQFEFYQTTGYLLSGNFRNLSVDDGVFTEEISRSGYFLATGASEVFDLFWTHVAGGNSLVGGKFQFLGGSRSSKAAGHKMAVSAGIGGNEHEAQGANTILFNLKGREMQLLYGYRFSEIVLAYGNLSFATYNYNGEVSSKYNTDGLEPSYESKMRSLFGGVDLSLGSFVGKIECGYQQLATTDTKKEARFVYGWSVGYSW